MLLWLVSASAILRCGFFFTHGMLVVLIPEITHNVRTRVSRRYLKSAIYGDQHYSKHVCLMIMCTMCILNPCFFLMGNKTECLDNWYKMDHTYCKHKKVTMYNLQGSIYACLNTSQCARWDDYWDVCHVCIDDHVETFGHKCYDGSMRRYAWRHCRPHKCIWHDESAHELVCVFPLHWCTQAYMPWSLCTVQVLMFMCTHTITMLAWAKWEICVRRVHTQIHPMKQINGDYVWKECIVIA